MDLNSRLWALGTVCSGHANRGGRQLGASHSHLERSLGHSEPRVQKRKEAQIKLEYGDRRSETKATSQ